MRRPSGRRSPSSGPCPAPSWRRGTSPRATPTSKSRRSDLALWYISAFVLAMSLIWRVVLVLGLWCCSRTPICISATRSSHGVCSLCTFARIHFDTCYCNVLLDLICRDIILIKSVLTWFRRYDSA
jgi:hypothetical protein